MAMVCPQCRKVFENDRDCPDCRVRLTFQPSQPTREAMAATAAPVEKWHQTPPGRVAAGLILTVGFGYGLLQLIGGALHFLGREADQDRLAPAVGFGVAMAALAVSAFMGGLVAGVGLRRGALFGMLIGLLGAGSALAAMHPGLLGETLRPILGDVLTASSADAQVELANVPLRTAVRYGSALLILLCGVVGGHIGSLIWQPPPSLAGPVFVAVPNRPAQALATGNVYRPAAPVAPSQWSGPFSWGRICIGALIAAAAAFVSKRVLEVIVALSDGAFRLSGAQQESIALRGLFAFALFIGAAIAGSARPNGMKQGLAVGIGAGAMQMGVLFLQQRMDESLIYVLLSGMILGPIGGWFGSSLAPPPPPPKLTGRTF